MTQRLHTFEESINEMLKISTGNREEMCAERERSNTELEKRYKEMTSNLRADIA